MPQASPVPEKEVPDSKSPSITENIVSAEAKPDSWHGANHHFRTTDSLSSAKSSPTVGTPNKPAVFSGAKATIQVFVPPHDVTAAPTPSPPRLNMDDSEEVSPSMLNNITLKLTVVESPKHGDSKQ